MSHQVHLVGSVPLPDARAVFSTVSAALGPHLKSIPDGETGERLDWITWLEPVFARHPAFEPSGETFQLHGALSGRTSATGLKPARRSRRALRQHLLRGQRHQILRGVRGIEAPGRYPGAGEIPGRSGPGAFGDLALRAGGPAPAVDTLFNDAVLREIDKIAAAIPHDQLAIQFDIASAVFARLERNQPSSYGNTKAEMQETFAGIVMRLANHVPADIDLMFHFCYGDAGHKHVVEPTDMGDMVEFANG